MKSSKFGVFKNGLEDTNLWYFLTGLGESTEYTVANTHRCMGKNQKFMFFIPDANLTSIR